MNTVANERKKSKMIASYADFLPPCNNACPAGENIQKWLNLAKEKKFKEAWETIVQNNPFPSIHGRVCYHYCETRCNRIQYDSTVGVHCVERFLGDMAIENGWTISPGAETHKKILVVGSGPAGLSAAYHLRLFGHDVTIYESLPMAGGTMLVGIPEYRLPKNILDSEVQRIFDMGVKIEYNHKVEDILAEKELGKFDSVFLAIGAHLGKNISYQTDQPCQTMDAVDYLREVAFDKSNKVGSRLAVYGGGNTAIDVARTAVRLGVSNVTIIYHRTRDKMAAFQHEINEALEEGINFVFLRTVVGLNKNTLMLGVNELDEKGRARQTGSFENLEIDALVFALSQIPDSDFLRKVSGIDVQANGVVAVDECFMTGHRGIFAGGDMIPYDRSVTVAVGQGKYAARYINSYLSRTTFNRPYRRDLAIFEKLHINSEKSEKTGQHTLDAVTRKKSFVEVVQDYTEEEVLYETNRCFSCGNCYECDACYNVCPVKAIAKLGIGKRYEINSDKCIGCSKCYKSCPCGAVVMLDRQN